MITATYSPRKITVGVGAKDITVEAKTPSITATYKTKALGTEVSSKRLSVSTGIPIVKIYEGDRPPYEGDYNVTPTNEEQILETSGKRMTGNVKVAPIPSNYGLISWNGSTITVS